MFHLLQQYFEFGVIPIQPDSVENSCAVNGNGVLAILIFGTAAEQRGWKRQNEEVYGR
jgi:hypothetical protein